MATLVAHVSSAFAVATAEVARLFHKAPLPGGLEPYDLVIVGPDPRHRSGGAPSPERVDQLHHLAARITADTIGSCTTPLQQQSGTSALSMRSRPPGHRRQGGTGQRAIGQRASR